MQKYDRIKACSSTYKTYLNSSGSGHESSTKEDSQLGACVLLVQALWTSLYRVWFVLCNETTGQSCN